jgi:hypothetical protein
MSQRGDYVTVTKGMSGHFAVLMRYYEDIQDYDVMQTGLGRYEDQLEALREASDWAEAHEIPLVLPRSRASQ